MFEKLITALLTLAALGIAATFAHREFAVRRGPGIPNPNVPVFQEGWEAAIGIGRTTGDSAPVQVVEFSDLECPYCAEAFKRFHSDTSSIERRYRSRIAYTFVHYPLSMHRFARPAARAAECARVTGRFFPFVSAIFAKQDSLGLRSWSAYARDAGITDIASFDRCTAATTALVDVEEGVNVGRSLAVASTPTIIINGWKFTGIMEESTYTNAIEAVLAGRKPAGVR